jgi:phospholipase C
VAHGTRRTAHDLNGREQHAMPVENTRPSSGLSRREFLAAAGVVGLGVGGWRGSRAASRPERTLPTPSEAPFDTVVVLMMENRSFDHMLGWLPGANGRQAGLSYRDVDGVAHPTWALAPDFQGCEHRDPGHTWEEIERQYAEGACDGFLRTAPLGDPFPIGYYREDDLPILSVLARSYTTFDNYFCSMMGATWQNRLYQLTGTTQVPMDQAFPTTDAERPCLIETAIFDRVRAAGHTAGYYHQGEPMTGLFRSKKYDDITYPISKFYDDAGTGQLPNVVFVEPNYTDAAEDDGTSNDYHHVGSVLRAEEFVATVHDALGSSPQWERMVFVLNFDEHGGFFDHVPPPRCRDDTVLVHDNAHGRRPDLRRLGFRVPAIAMGPFAPRRIEHAGPYEHCSILKMIAWRWGLAPLTVRDRTARNLARALDFRHHREPVALPPFRAPQPLTAPACSPPT